MSFTKTCRKLCSFVAVVLAFFFLVGCQIQPGQDSEREINKKAAEAAVQDIEKALIWDPTAMKNLTVSSINLTTTTKYDNVTVSWESSEEDVISADGTITRIWYEDPRTVVEDGNYVVPVTLTATITGTYSYTSGENTIENAVEAKKEFKFTVKSLKPETEGTIAECKAAAWTYVYETKGVQKALVSDSATTYNVRFTGIVTAKLLNGGMGLMVHDGTEGIYVYTNNADFEVGDTVDVVGNIYTYYGSLQVGSEVTIKKIDAVEGMKIGEYREISVQEWEDENKDLNKSIGYFGGKLLKVYGKLEKSSNTSTSDIYKLVDAYTGEVAWVYYKSYESGNTELDAWDGKYVYIYGVSYDRDSRLVKNHLLWNGNIEEAPAPELTDAQKVDQVKAVLAGLAGKHVSGTKLALPTENAEYGATITWKLSDETLLVNGVFALVEADTKLTATATITIGETTVEYPVEMTVLKLSTYTVAAASKLEAGTVVKLVGTVEVVYSKYNNFYLKDATGNLLVYKSLPEGIKLGDKIELVGKVAYYNGTPQIGEIISTTLLSAAAWEMSTPKAMTVAEIVAFDAKTALYGQYMYAKGLLVKSGNYYYLADATDTSVRISLYNSTVAAEELVAVVDTETEVTLFFYFYGNSKSNWSEGEKRVIFVQREGEYFIGEEEVVLPEARTYQTLAEAKAMVGQEVTVRGVVTAVSPYASQYGNFGVLIEDATDGLYLYRVSGEEAYAKFIVGQEIEVTGTMDCYNGLYEMKDVQMDSFKVVNEKATIPGPTPMSNELQDQAKVVELKEAVWNGSAFEKDGSTYAYFYSSSWLSEKPELVKGATYTVIGWLNWYNAPQISPLQAPELVSEAPAHTHTACPECGKCTDKDCDGAAADKCAGHEVQPEQPTAGLVEGKAYVIGAENGKGVLYFNGTQTSGRFNGVYVKEDATKVYVEIVDGNYKLYFLNGETKTYVVMDDKSSGGSFTTDAASATVFEWNAEKNTLAVAEDSNNRAFGVGATSTYDNFSCYDLTGTYNWGQFEAVEGTTPEQPETPKHEHVACPECGKCTAEDCDGAEAEKCAGHEAQPEQPSENEIAGSADFGTIEIAHSSGGDSSYKNTYTTASGWVSTNSAIQAGKESGDANPQYEFIGPDNTHKAVCLNGKSGAAGTLTSPTLTGGVSKVAFKWAKVFTDTAINFTLIVTDLSTGEKYEKTVDWSGGKNDNQKVANLVEFELETPITGDFTIQFVNNCPSGNTSSNKDRATILEVVWYK